MAGLQFAPDGRPIPPDTSKLGRKAANSLRWQYDQALKTYNDGVRASAAARQAEAEAAKANADIRKQEQARSPAERAYQIGLSIAGPAAGIYVGHKLANRIEARHNKTVAAQNRALKALGGEARRITPGSANAYARLSATVKAADRMRLTRARGPLGITTAGLLLAEGATARFVIAPTIENESARQAFQQLGTASAFAATSLVGERLVQNRTPEKLISAKDVASIETAREMSRQLKEAKRNRIVLPGAPATAVASGTSRALTRVGKLGTAALVGATATAYFSARDAARAEGQSNATANANAMKAAGVTAGLGLATGAVVAKGGQFVGRQVAARAAAAQKAGGTLGRVAGVASRALAASAPIRPFLGPLGVALTVGSIAVGGVQAYRAYRREKASEAVRTVNRHRVNMALAARRASQRSDGMVDAHYRMTASGKRAFVQAYRRNPQ